MISSSSSSHRWHGHPPHCHRQQIIQIFAIIINNIIIIHVIAIIANKIIINNIIPDESFADLWVWWVQKVQSQAGVEGAQGQAGDDKQKHDGDDDGGDDDGGDESGCRVWASWSSRAATRRPARASSSPTSRKGALPSMWVFVLDVSLIHWVWCGWGWNLDFNLQSK